MDYRRLKNVFLYGWKDTAEISHETGCNRIGLFLDMLSCYLKYYVFGYQYKKMKLYSVQGEERREICLKLQQENIKQIQWQNEFYHNYKFLNKWSSLKYEQSPDLQKKKWAAYTKRYGFGKNCVIGHDVLLVRHHHLDGTISVGNNVLMAKHTLIDYSGELIIHDNVKISDGVLIETHSHPALTNANANGSKKEKLEIFEFVNLGARSYITESCHKIGRYAKIGGGSVVRCNIPPYAIVIGNPAKIIGFLFSPEEMSEFETRHYPESERTPKEKYAAIYQKYYKDKLNIIKDYHKL